MKKIAITCALLSSLVASSVWADAASDLKSRLDKVSSFHASFTQKVTDGSGNAVQEHNEVEAASLPFEFMMNALRLADGFHPSLFEARTAQPISRILPQLKAAEAEGLIDVGPEKIAPTAKGRRFLNVLLEKFL